MTIVAIFQKWGPSQPRSTRVTIHIFRVWASTVSASRLVDMGFTIVRQARTTFTVGLSVRFRQ
jgi:hypothetical protein